MIAELLPFAHTQHHHRCYRNKATCRYLVLGRSGVEFVDLKTGEGEPHHWVRGTCQYGVMPCNGLLYVPPDSCAREQLARIATQRSSSQSWRTFERR